MVTFIIGGIWHGAGWTFIFWGFLHGFALVVHRIWNQLGFRFNLIIGWIITFNFVNIAWIFFRAKEWEDALKVLRGMFRFGEISAKHATINLGGEYGFNIIGWIFASFIICLLLNNSYKTLEKEVSPWIIIATSFVFVYAMISSLISSTEIFLYFNF